MTAAGRLDNFVGELVRALATVHKVAVQVNPVTSTVRLSERSYDLASNGNVVTVKLAESHAKTGKWMISLRSGFLGDGYLMEQHETPVAAVIAFVLQQQPGSLPRR